MTHRGDILLTEVATPLRTIPLFPWRRLTAGTEYGSFGTTAILSGVCNIGGSPVANVPVRAYFRATGQLVQEVRSAANGTFVLTGISAQDIQAYYVVADYPAPQAAQIFSLLTPG